jgi:hypothetical protein
MGGDVGVGERSMLGPAGKKTSARAAFLGSFEVRERPGRLRRKDPARRRRRARNRPDRSREAPPLACGFRGDGGRGTTDPRTARLRSQPGTPPAIAGGTGATGRSKANRRRSSLRASGSYRTLEDPAENRAESRTFARIAISPICLISPIRPTNRIGRIGLIGPTGRPRLAAGAGQQSGPWRGVALGRENGQMPMIGRGNDDKKGDLGRVGRFRSGNQGVCP